MSQSKKKQSELRDEQAWERIDEAVFESQHFLEKYQKQILIAVAVITVIVCGYFAYQKLYVEPQNNEAQVAMFRGEQYFRMGQDSLAIHGDGNGFDGLEAVASKYSSTKAGKLAKLYAGISQARLGNYEQALADLKGYSGSDKIISNLVNGTIGDCLVNTGKASEAIPYFIKGAEAVDNATQSPILYKKAALVYREEGNYDKVIEIFTLVRDRYANSMAAMEAPKYIEEAKLMKAGK